MLCQPRNVSWITKKGPRVIHEALRNPRNNVFVLQLFQRFPGFLHPWEPVA